MEPEPAYNGYSNYVIKSIFVLCFENTVTMCSKTKESLSKCTHLCQLGYRLAEITVLKLVASLLDFLTVTIF